MLVASTARRVAVTDGGDALIGLLRRSAVNGTHRSATRLSHCVTPAPSSAALSRVKQCSPCGERVVRKCCAHGLARSTPHRAAFEYLYRESRTCSHFGG